MPELAYLNGKFMPIEEAMVPIEDRGYNFGDAVYEVANSYNGGFFGLEEHLDRLERSLRELSYPPISRDKIREGMLELLKRSEMDRAGVYLQISRGVAPRLHAYTDVKEPQIVMTVRRVKDVPAEFRENGVSAITVKDIRWGRCDIKTVLLLPNCMAKQQALEADAYDAIFVTEEGIVRETTISNVFIVKNGVVITHPENQNILNGITRIMTIDCCRELDLPLEERLYTSDDMFSADEVFFSGTTIEVLGVVNIDNRPIADGKVGPVTRRLYEALHAKTPN